MKRLWLAAAIFAVQIFNPGGGGLQPKRVVIVPNAATITPNTNLADISQQVNTQSTGPLIINADAGVPSNGQQWILKIQSTNVQTFIWNQQYAGGTVALPTATTGGGKIDQYGFIYDTINSHWQFVAGATGF